MGLRDIDSMRSCLLSLILIVPLESLAFELIPSIAVGVESSDNIRKSDTNPESETLLRSTASAVFRQVDGPLVITGNAGLTQSRYQDESYEDTDYFTLNSSIGWTALEDRLRISVQDRYRQNRVDSLGADTPDNIQDTNIFRLRVDLQLINAGRHTLTLTPTYSRTYYELLATDNESSALDISWYYQMYRHTRIGLSVSDTSIEYDSFSASDYDIQRTQLLISTVRPRAEINLGIGISEIGSGVSSSVDSTTGFLNWRQELTSRSLAVLDLNRSLSDLSSTVNLSGETADPGIDEEPIAADTIERDSASLTYTLESRSVTTSLRVGARRIDYLQTNNDKRLKDIGLGVNYAMTSVSSLRFAYRSSYVTNKADGREDQDDTLSLIYRHRFTRAMDASLKFVLANRDSSQDAFDFDETRIAANLSYTFGKR